MTQSFPRNKVSQAGVNIDNLWQSDVKDYQSSIDIDFKLKMPE